MITQGGNMNIGKFLLDLGSDLISSTPLGAVAMPILNALLPDDMQLGKDATGKDAEAAISKLPPAEAAKINLAEINLAVEEERGRTARYEAMCKGDGQETRAILVNKAMNALIAISIIFVAAIAYVYIEKGAEAAFSVEMAAVYGVGSATFAYVVRAYFGDLRTETTSRHQTIDEKPKALGLLAGLLAKR
ncbi:MAG: hypothetical protein MJK15_00715 [Colwellia sp.]|nr:hypothetical protein [Colwellia sp.]